jgi:hypothetical protein
MSILNTVLVEVDVQACQRLAAFLARQTIPSDAEETSLSGFSREDVGDFYLFLVAICHQTSPIGSPPLLGTVGGRERRGWDYLLGRFEEMVRQDRGLLTRARWRQLSDAELESLFTDGTYGPRLIGVERRAALIRDLASVMDSHNWNHLEDLYTLAKRRVASGDPNLVSLLSSFQAYGDPVNKKTFYLLALMRNHGFWKYVDPDKLGPPVDYHEVRGHLRLGTVTVLSSELRAKLRRQQPVEEFEDLAIRSAVYRAIMEISRLSGISDPSRLHYLFWNVFRSCCQRDETHCSGCPRSCPLPARYVPLALGPDGRACPFHTVCQGARDPEVRKLIEQVVSPGYDFH